MVVCGAQCRVNLATMGGRLAREVRDRQRAPREQGGQPLGLRLNDLLGLIVWSERLPKGLLKHSTHEGLGFI